MTNDRNSRDQESRAADNVHDTHDDVYEDSPALLDASKMPPREGFVQRWVRTTINDEDDQSNVYRRINQGWKPRKASTVITSEFVPTIKYQGADIIGIHGNILMERPIELQERQERHERKLASDQMKAVTNDMHKVHDAGSGITRPEFTEQKSKVTKGRVAPVAPD